MAIRNIVLDGDDVLRKVSRPVTIFDEKLHLLLDDMAETMHKAEGVGLAAPQVGILRRVIVVDVGEGVIELINPELISKRGSQTGNEGCLSFPGQWGIVTRPMKVKVKAQNRYGEEIIVKGEALLARALCHEIDHLNGVVFVDLAERMLGPDED
ncbi:MAG TPA: peptide deformylase [Firmicutes bacterium]|nr:peptide deformylase [Bacillota bacterium]